MGRSSRQPGGKVASHRFVEQSIFLFTNAAISLAAEANGVTVTHIRNITPGKSKTKAR